MTCTTFWHQANHSVSQRERLETYYETPRGAKERTDKQTNKIKEGKTKLKNHICKAQNYQLKKDEFIEFLQNVKPGSAISCPKI